MSSQRSDPGECKHCGHPLREDDLGRVCHACMMGEALGADSVEAGVDTALPESEIQAVQGNKSLMPDPLEGTTLGPDGRYKILQGLGEGGFGMVFMAEQIAPVRRRVAVKVLKAGMDTRQVVARFEAERQALAMMDHPNIAKVFDGGETGQGRPFFVMELVRGTPITAYCDREQLDTKARLTLFTQVCEAVQHAHQKGIIHRDLKPANILVTAPDGAEPVPKVIDFGVAKALENNLTDKTLFTRFEQMIGTPAYMSPEQAGTEGGIDVDTRADIYALGVLLYELLTGTTPFDSKTLQQAAFEEVRRILHEDDAPRPSARLSSLELGRRTTIAKERGTEAAGLNKLLRGDLDWIVMKAIEKDRRRRYETAIALGEEITRLLNSEPVLARPPTTGYRLKRFAVRKKSLLTTIVVVASALVIASIVSTLSAVRASESARIAEERLAQIENEQRFKEAAQKDAEIQKNQAIWNQYVARQFPMSAACSTRSFGDLDALLAQQVPAKGQPDFRGWEWAYFRDQCDQAITTIDAHFPAWHPTERTLAVMSAKSSSELAIELRSPNDGSVLRTLATIPVEPSTNGLELRWSDDGARLAYLMNSGVVGVLRAASGEHLFRVDLNGDDASVDAEVTAVDLSTDGSLLAVGNWFGKIELWDVVTGERTRILRDPESRSWVRSLRFNSSSKYLAASLRLGQRTTWNITTGEHFHYARQSAEAGRLTWNPAGTRFAATNKDSFAIYEIGRAEPIRTFPHQSVHGVTWIDDSRIASSGYDQVVRIWDQVANKQPIAEHRVSRGVPGALDSSRDKQLLAVDTEDGTRIFRVGDIPEAEILLEAEPIIRGLHHLIWRRDGVQLLSGHLQNRGRGLYDTTIRTWDTVREKLERQSKFTILRALGWNPDHTAVWMMGINGEFGVLNIGEEEIRLRPPLPVVPGRHQVTSISPDGRWITCWQDRTILLLDAASCELVRSTEIPDDGRSIRWSHDSRFIAIGANEFPILWNPIADQYLQGTPASERILDLAWSSDDRLIALGLRNGQIEICRTDTLEVVTRLKGHRGEAASVDWADHGRIASAGGDWMVRIWDAATGHELLALPHRGKSPFSSVRWSPDGRRLAAGDRDGRVLIWGSTELELLNRPESLGSGVIAETGLSVQRPLESMHADPPSPSEAIAGLRSEIAQQEAALAVLRREPESLELGLALVALAKLRWLETGEGWKSPLSEADQVFERLLEQNPDNADLAYAICGSLLSPWALTPERLRRAERRLFPEGLEKFIPRRQECPPPGIWPLLHAAYGRPEYQTHLDDMLQVWAELAKEDVSYATDELIGAHTRMFLKANKQGDHETAVELGETGLEVRRNADGDEHPGTMQAMRNLAVCYQNAHRHDEACEMGEEVLALRRKVLGSEHPDTLDALVVLAWALEGAGRFDDALEARLEVLEVSRELYGEEHVQALNAKLSLANAYEKVGRLDKAAELRGPGHELVEPDSPRATTILVPPTSVWRWLHPMDGVDPAEVDSDFHRSFFRADYDDASWQTGKDSQARIGLLGAQLTTEAEGVVVKALTPESPGGQDGLLAGDLIRTLDGEPFEEHPALVARLAATKPGERVVISVLRDDDVKELTVTLGSGPECGGFGYGDEWFTGVDIGTPAEKGLSKAAYFRHRFTTDKPFSNLELRCQRDDGIVVYLDGQEVGRANMNEGEESFLLAAESTVGDAAETTTFRLPLEGVTLQPGEHVLAISLHNTEAPSSDLRIGGITLVEVEEESE